MASSKPSQRRRSSVSFFFRIGLGCPNLASCPSNKQNDNEAKPPHPTEPRHGTTPPHATHIGAPNQARHTQCNLNMGTPHPTPTQCNPNMEQPHSTPTLPTPPKRTHTTPQCPQPNRSVCTGALSLWNERNNRFLHMLARSRPPSFNGIAECIRAGALLPYGALLP
jgi:hypothetical protein